MDVVPFEKKKAVEPFCRTSITDAGRKRLEELPPFIGGSLFRRGKSAGGLQKKSEAEFLYRTLAGTVENCFHLSASMCMAHRRRTLEQIYQALVKRKEKVLCIATQVIEAGVDISFFNGSSGWLPVWTALCRRPGDATATGKKKCRFLCMWYSVRMKIWENYRRFKRRKRLPSRFWRNFEKAGGISERFGLR